MRMSAACWRRGRRWRWGRCQKRYRLMIWCRWWWRRWSRWLMMNIRAIIVVMVIVVVIMV